MKLYGAAHKREQLWLLAEITFMKIYAWIRTTFTPKVAWLNMFLKLGNILPPTSQLNSAFSSLFILSTHNWNYVQWLQFLPRGQACKLQQHEGMAIHYILQFSSHSLFLTRPWMSPHSGTKTELPPYMQTGKNDQSNLL